MGFVGFIYLVGFWVCIKLVFVVEGVVRWRGEDGYVLGWGVIIILGGFL